MYAPNVLNLEPIQKFRGFLDKYGIDKVKQIVDSYDSMAIYEKDKAREQIKDYFKIDDDILDRAILHVTKKEGRIISVDKHNEEIKNLETKVSNTNYNLSDKTTSITNSYYGGVAEKPSDTANVEESYGRKGLGESVRDGYTGLKNRTRKFGESVRDVGKRVFQISQIPYDPEPSLVYSQAGALGIRIPNIRNLSRRTKILGISGVALAALGGFLYFKGPTYYQDFKGKAENWVKSIAAETFKPQHDSLKKEINDIAVLAVKVEVAQAFDPQLATLKGTLDKQAEVIAKEQENYNKLRTFVEDYIRKEQERKTQQTQVSAVQVASAQAGQQYAGVTTQPIQTTSSTAKTLIGALREQGLKVNYAQPAEEHERYIRGEVRYNDLSRAAKAWFGLHTPEVKFEIKDGRHLVRYRLKANKKIPALEDHILHAMVGNQPHLGLKSDVWYTKDIGIPEYYTLKAMRNPIPKVMLTKQAGDKVLIKSSLNYQRQRARVGRIAQHRPTATFQPQVAQQPTRALGKRTGTINDIRNPTFR